MDTLDLILLGLLAVAGLRGYWRGLFVEIMALVSVVAATGAGLVLAEQVGDRIAARIALPAPLAAGIGFFLVFFSVVVAVRLLRAIVARLWAGSSESRWNSAGGLLFGAFKGALLLGALIAVVRSPFGGDDVAYGSLARRSRFGPLATVQETIDESAVAVGLSSFSVGFFSVFGDLEALTGTAGKLGGR